MAKLDQDQLTQIVAAVLASLGQGQTDQSREMVVGYNNPAD
jgi:hypothetical protein